jgi:hypothetical protein
MIPMMIAAVARHVEIDSTHSAAICREIGQRLDREFRKEAPELSPELERLLAQLQDIDWQDERQST